MLPKWHVVLGLIFSIIIYFATGITILEASLIFFASVFIDFDHYTWYVQKTKDFSLKRAYCYLRDQSKHNKRTLMVFHTIEFHIFTALLIFVWTGFLFILIGQKILQQIYN